MDNTEKKDEFELFLQIVSDETLDFEKKEGEA